MAIKHKKLVGFSTSQGKVGGNGNPKNAEHEERREMGRAISTTGKKVLIVRTYGMIDIGTSLIEVHHSMKDKPLSKLVDVRVV